ncbi:MAG TPA: glycogen debranching protein GlgX [Microbacteriaceae bacterium]|nr:glycogen debranching protein GlgX [Microbacteriaceae bacterium]
MSPAAPARSLGLHRVSGGFELRVWSKSALAMTVTIYPPDSAETARVSLPLVKQRGSVWVVRSEAFTVGSSYTICAAGPTGPQHAFDPSKPLVDPYARGVQWFGGELRAVVVDDEFDWAADAKPLVPLERAVVYEVHVKGFSKLNTAIPLELRGTYAGLGHEESIRYLQDLGITTVELLPVQSFVSESHLLERGAVNYWGYNTVGFFAPHAAYATRTAQAEGADAVVREFKAMVRSLHAAGIEVILDVVYNHTAEEGLGGPVFHFRGLDNKHYYRQDPKGHYIDTTGCGNTVNFGEPAAVALVLDSMRYWATEMGVDGFRLDLATTLGRGAHGEYSPQHPLLQAMLSDPVISASKLIAEPWDVGWGGWQTGNFPAGFSEWNDRYRDRMRDFWLGDLRRERESGNAGSGIGRFATRLAGSSNTFSEDRGPLASVNFVTAHDGFTLFDLTAFDGKHNEANGEHNRDGSDNNTSYNHGVEGFTHDPGVLADRRKSVRNLLGTLLLSAGVPMLCAGDEYGRSQRGNNNAYCQDGEMTWLSWQRTPEQEMLFRITRRLIRMRRENPALRPERFGRFGETVPNASQMDWYNAKGQTMSVDDWNNPIERTLQYLAASSPDDEDFNRILLVVHARESDQNVVLAQHAGVTGYRRIWDSALEAPPASGHAAEFLAGDTIVMSPRSMQLFWAF